MQYRLHIQNYHYFTVLRDLGKQSTSDGGVRERREREGVPDQMYGEGGGGAGCSVMIPLIGGFLANDLKAAITFHRRAPL